MARKIKVLMVCLGNICRSPLADGMLRDKVRKHDLPVEVDSCGTGDWHVGEAPDQRMTKTAAERGLDISHLRARQFHIDDFEEFDLIYVMDHSNRQNVLDLAPNPELASKVKLLLNEIQEDSDSEVPDPYFGGEAGFSHVFDLVDQATDRVMDRIRRDFL